jgi:hypothetical protein
MRNAVGIFGALCGLVVIGLVGRYGFKTTDVEADAWIVAFLYMCIAAGGLFGHVVAVRLWRYSKRVAIAATIVSAGALLLNLSNSLGAIAGRADTATMERVKTNRAIRAAEGDLERLTRLRNAMPAFVQTDEEAVKAAKRAATTAESRRKAECGENNEKRGKECKKREEEESAATNRVTEVTAAKAAADRAGKLEADAQTQRERLSALGPTVTENVQGWALAKLFRLPDAEADFAATAQQFGIAIVVELIIVMCMIAWEVLGHAVHRPEPLNPPATRSKRLLDRLWHRLKAPKAESGPAVIEAPAPKPVTKLPAPPRPQLVTDSPYPPAGSIPVILTAILEPAAGQRVEIEECHRGYAVQCRSESRRIVPPAQFVDPLKQFCRRSGIDTKTEGDRFYLLDVKLVAPLAQVSQPEKRARRRHGRT